MMWRDIDIRQLYLRSSRSGEEFDLTNNFQETLIGGFLNGLGGGKRKFNAEETIIGQRRKIRNKEFELPNLTGTLSFIGKSREEVYNMKNHFVKFLQKNDQQNYLSEEKLRLYYKSPTTEIEMFAFVEVDYTHNYETRNDLCIWDFELDISFNSMWQQVSTVLSVDFTSEEKDSKNFKHEFPYTYNTSYALSEWYQFENDSELPSSYNLELTGVGDFISFEFEFENGSNKRVIISDLGMSNGKISINSNPNNEYAIYEELDTYKLVPKIDFIGGDSPFFLMPYGTIKFRITSTQNQNQSLRLFILKEFNDIR